MTNLLNILIILFLIPISNSFPINFPFKIDDLFKKFGVNLREKVNDENSKIRQKNPKIEYEDSFAREKLMPMAAAAYGNDENAIKKCLNKTFADGRLHRNIQMACQAERDQICSAFTAISHSQKAIILAFRGTNTFPQLLMEIGQTMFAPKVNSPFGVGKVSAYFSSIFGGFLRKGGIIEDVANLANKFPEYQIWITGHSLGGALAALAAAEIYAKNVSAASRIKFVTFGQPRTGDSVWAAKMDSAFPLSANRVVHSQDIVPHVPPRLFQNYRHHKTQIWYENEMKIKYFVICAEDKINDENCKTKKGFLRISDHLIYFGVNLLQFGRSGCEMKTNRIGLGDLIGFL